MYKLLQALFYIAALSDIPAKCDQKEESSSAFVNWASNLTEERRSQLFHPVIIFPNNKYEVLDLRNGFPQNIPEYSVGKYNEDRHGIYETELFENTTHSIDGYGGRRTVHMGIDLNGPVMTPVYSFADGVVHSIGYNSDPGDYGYVMVIEYDFSSTSRGSTPACSEKERSSDSSHRVDDTIKIYALYGHLAAKSIENKETGSVVKKGEVIGWLGDRTENGGWGPHLHLQLSISAPDTHDMPGVVAKHTLSQALIDYPDPRLIVGDLY